MPAASESSFDLLQRRAHDVEALVQRLHRLAAVLDQSDESFHGIVLSVKDDLLVEGLLTGHLQVRTWWVTPLGIYSQASALCMTGMGLRHHTSAFASGILRKPM